MALTILNNSVHNHDVKMKRGQRPYNDIVDCIIKNNHKMTDKEIAVACMQGCDVTTSETPVRRIRYTKTHYIKASPTLMAKMERNSNKAKLKKLDKVIATEVMGKTVTVRNIKKFQRLLAKRDGIELALNS